MMMEHILVLEFFRPVWIVIIGEVANRGYWGW